MQKVLVSNQFLKTQNASTNESSPHTCHELQSLNHLERSILFLLVWGSTCHGRTLRTAPAQIILTSIALVSLLRLLPYGSNTPHPGEANHLSEFF